MGNFVFCMSCNLNPVPENGNSVVYFKNFFQVMGNINNPDTILSTFFYKPEQVIYFTCTVGRSWFIQNEDFCLTCHGPGNLNGLFLRYVQRSDQDVHF